MNILFESEVLKPMVCLRRLYEDEEIALDPTDGTKTIVQAKDVFTGGIDPDLVKWGLDVPGNPTKITEALVTEPIRNSHSLQVLGSVGYPYRPGLTQHQIVDFCVKHEDKLCQKGRTCFPFWGSDRVFVAVVHVNSNGRLRVYCYRIWRGYVWDILCRRRFVFPQIPLRPLGP